MAMTTRLAAWLPGCLAAGQFGCLAAWLPGWMAQSWTVARANSAACAARCFTTIIWRGDGKTAQSLEQQHQCLTTSKQARTDMTYSLSRDSVRRM